MSFSPDAESLLLIARQCVLDQLLPQLPETLHYQARMVANAMVIAAREYRVGQATQINELILIHGLFEACETAPSSRELSMAIRRGDFDQPGPQQEQMLSALSQIVRGNLSISKPKAVLK